MLLLPWRFWPLWRFFIVTFKGFLLTFTKWSVMKLNSNEQDLQQTSWAYSISMRSFLMDVTFQISLQKHKKIGFFQQWFKDFLSVPDSKNVFTYSCWDLCTTWRYSFLGRSWCYYERIIYFFKKEKPGLYFHNLLLEAYPRLLSKEKVQNILPPYLTSDKLTWFPIPNDFFSNLRGNALKWEKTNFFIGEKMF